MDSSCESESDNGNEPDEYTYTIVTRSVARRRLRWLQQRQQQQQQQQQVKPRKRKKRVKAEDWEEARKRTRLQCRPGLMSLPSEIHLVILAFLGAQDLNAMRKVSRYFGDIVRDPILWKDYEVSDNDMSTADVINDLKRMPLLKKININGRLDCDYILRQISLSNRNLEELYIFNCTGSSPSRYLRSSYLTRIVERCCRLHTVSVYGMRFRGLKFYRLLGEVVGPRLRALLAPLMPAQFETFARHLRHVAEKDRELIGALSRHRSRKDWSYLQYSRPEKQEQPSVVLISYYVDEENLAHLPIQSLAIETTVESTS